MNSIPKEIKDKNKKILEDHMEKFQDSSDEEPEFEDFTDEGKPKYTNIRDELKQSIYFF